MKSFKGQTMAEAEKSLAKLSNETNHLKNNENTLPTENDVSGPQSKEAIPNRRFSNLLNIKAKLAKRISRLGSLEDTYHRIEQQNKDAEQSLLIAVVKALKITIGGKKTSISDSELLQMLDTINMKSVDIERFVSFFEQSDRVITNSNTNKTDYTIITESNQTMRSMDNR